MKRFTLLILLLLPIAGWCQQGDFEIFEEAYKQWSKSTKSKQAQHLEMTEYAAIADQLIAGQNDDGGWPKNLDWTLRAMNPDSVKLALKPHSRESTLDNRTVYLQVEYLSAVYILTAEERYRDASLRGMEYMLSTQYPDGGWRGWDADAITFNDGVTTGALYLWQRILYGKEPFKWVDEAMKSRIEASWNRGLEVILRTQYVQNGVKTVWAQQYDHQTFMPVKARSYEHPSLSSSESSEILQLLMRIRKPTPEVIEAVKAGVAWLEANKILGKRIEMVSMPEGNPEDRSVKRDCRLVDDPDAEPIWARFYELSDNQPFLCNRDGIKVYRLEDVAPERRVGYAWYGTWPEKVLKNYDSWLKKHTQE